MGLLGYLAGEGGIYKGRGEGNVSSGIRRELGFTSEWGGREIEDSGWIDISEGRTLWTDLSHTLGSKVPME